MATAVMATRPHTESDHYHWGCRPPSLCDTGSNTDIDISIHRVDTVMATNDYGHSSDGHTQSHHYHWGRHPQSLCETGSNTDRDITHRDDIMSATT